MNKINYIINGEEITRDEALKIVWFLAEKSFIGIIRESIKAKLMKKRGQIK